MRTDDAPPPLGILFGSQLGWSPARESQPLDSRCGTCGGTIAEGSRLYCAACARTGFEAQLSLARRRAAKARKAAAKHLPKGVRKEAMKTAEGRAWLREQGHDAPEPPRLTVKEARALAREQPDSAGWLREQGHEV